MAADLYVPPAAAPVVAPVASGWDGPYIGATLGYGWQTLASPTNATGNGWSVGGQIGYNAHLSDNIIGGVEGNLDWVNYASSPTGAYSVNWDGSLRARLGVDMGQWMPYAEVGVAFANVTDVTATTSPEVRTGWTAGAGVEVMLADHLSANLEYR
ncbi:MAG: outer membrane protein [Devosia sp.]